ncbi:Alcohol dehydrogenase transcription factor Myb/SANT-like [Nesidiocoris tenuis]|uniref:Alcohol dehydrogenase transcription factor Myb/SANT-like n=1 Tax=Nesidiocoris tenuis TaxID=355587 RepID=A0ABN7BDR6_9HEMI|nr:Alcohol dehydrogenase transcription factor Myb/SANT-like [Nesidiocoris tenuis]
MPLLKRKIEHLRGSYRREQKRASVRYNRPNGEYKPRLWYYELMGFLDKIAKRPDREFDDCILSNDEEPRTPSPRLLTPGHPQEKQKTEDHGQLGLRSSTKNAAEDRDLMGRSLAVQLKKLMPHQRVVANKLISDIVFYGNLGKLSENSAVIVSRPLVHDQVTTPPNAQLPLMTSVQDLQKLLKVGSMRADGEISDEEVTVEDAMEDYPNIQIENGMIHPMKEEEEEEDSFGS